MPSLIALLALGACAHADAGQQGNGPQASSAMTGQMGQRPPMMHQQDLQQYADEANAASDKTVLTKDAFTAEMTALRQKQMAQFQAQGNGQQGNRPRFGSGAGMRMQRGSGSTNGQDRLATATTFWKYTNPAGVETLLALDANGNVLLKYPMAFGRRGGSGSGRQMPMGMSQGGQ